MSMDHKTLVVGTTSDYIEWLRQKAKGRVVFLTDNNIRNGAREPRPAPNEEICLHLQSCLHSPEIVERELRDRKIDVSGIACFDCESMALAARIADRLQLNYCSLESIDNCRNKNRAAQLWQAAGLGTTTFKIIRTEKEARDFLKTRGRSCVLKPTTGSGSELVFLAHSEDDLGPIFQLIETGLRNRTSHPLYSTGQRSQAEIMIEELVEGNEYSCDFSVNDSRVEILRIARKIMKPKGPLGTVMGYIVPAALPSDITLAAFEDTLRKSAHALGIHRAICMVDFFIDRGKTILLELAPRPGGDCLPALIRHVYNMDILTAAIDFAQTGSTARPRSNGVACVGLRIHAPARGILKAQGTKTEIADPRIREISFCRRPGHRIELPPLDYDSWILGHVIFAPNEQELIEQQCASILQQLQIEIEMDK